ncbi:ATP-binding protein [Bacillus solitudinis]|uniref:ATP-binding protein n=1 Tax=Bacillus solitudinis TaxID=2014074 RepID=UPI000C232265|nr:ATP-binding protein [Bacillus solitudinis]
MGFKLIISNIISNAIKYSYENGTVTILGFIENNHIHIENVDRGIGMSSEQIDKLFQKYQKLNDEAPGQGISIVYGL